jgi:hypothetical protein
MKMILYGVLRDSEQLILPGGWAILLSDLEVAELSDRFLSSNDMNLGFVAQLAAGCITLTDRTWLPFLLKTEASTPEIVAKHLFAGECLPEVRSHPILPNSCI